MPVACGCIPSGALFGCSNHVQNRDPRGNNPDPVSQPTCSCLPPRRITKPDQARHALGAPCSALCAAPDTRDLGRAARNFQQTARGNNHRSCLAAPLCKLSCQPLGTDHEGPDQAQPRPRQPPVARAVRGHQDTREPGSRSEKFSAESRPLGETITDPVSQPHYASCLAGPSERITKAQIKPSHALGSPLWRARQQQT